MKKINSAEPLIHELKGVRNVVLVMSCIFTVIAFLLILLALYTHQIGPFIIASARNGNAFWGFLFLLWAATTWVTYFMVKNLSRKSLWPEDVKESEQITDVIDKNQSSKKPSLNIDYRMSIKVELVFLVSGLLILLEYRDRWSQIWGGILVFSSLVALLISSYKLIQEYRSKKGNEDKPLPDNQPNLKGE